VPGMKLTPNTAMRARDVSRPRAEHLAEAAEARGPEGTGGAGREGGGAGGADRAADSARRATDSARRATDSAGRAAAGPGERAAAAAAAAGRGRAEAAGAGARDWPGGQDGKPGFPRKRRGPRDGGGRRGRAGR
jgi:hypothetical protein